MNLKSWTLSLTFDFPPFYFFSSFISSEYHCVFGCTVTIFCCNGATLLIMYLIDQRTNCSGHCWKSLATNCGYIQTSSFLSNIWHWQIAVTILIMICNMPVVNAECDSFIHNLYCMNPLVQCLLHGGSHPQGIASPLPNLVRWILVNTNINGQGDDSHYRGLFLVLILQFNTAQ